MARWKWWQRPDGTVDVVGANERVEVAAEDAAQVAENIRRVAARRSWNAPTTILGTIDFTPAAMYRIRSAAWRWPE